MKKCKNCGKIFRIEKKEYENYDTREPEKFYIYYVCPYCRSENYENIDRIGHVKITKHELEQYREIINEIEYLKRMRFKEKENINSYKNRQRTTENREKIIEKLEELEELIENKELRAIAIKIKIENYIFNINDSLIRQIIENRYIKNMTWARVAVELGGYYSEDYIRIISSRYINKN